MRFVILGLFTLTYLGISARRLRLLPIGRPAMALVGAAAVMVAGSLAGPDGLSTDEALRAVEPHTLALLLGMMVVAAGLGEAGLFEWVVSVVARRRLSPVALLWATTFGSGALAAVLVNDPVCLLLTPLVVSLVRALSLPLKPFLFAIAMGANAGSALTLAGNPQNMLVAKLSGLSYRAYLASSVGPSLVGLTVTALVLHGLFREALRRPVEPPPPGPPPQLDRPFLLVGLVALAGIVVANLAGASLALTALCGAAVVLLASRLKAEALLAQVDWSILVFFAGLFIVVAGLQKTGFPAQWLTSLDAPHAGPGPVVAVLTLGSQVVSNVPLILLLEPWIRLLPDPAHAWTLTAWVATVAGNLTLLGSVANVIVIERAKASMGFVEYLAVGLPVTALSLGAGVTWLLWLG